MIGPNDTFPNIPSASNSYSTKATSRSMMISMPLFVDNQTPDISKFVDEISLNWNLKVENLELEDRKSVWFTIDQIDVVMRYIDTPVPNKVIQNVISYNYNLANVKEELTNHSGHVIHVTNRRERTLPKVKI